MSASSTESDSPEYSMITEKSFLGEGTSRGPGKKRIETTRFKNIGEEMSGAVPKEKRPKKILPSESDSDSAGEGTSRGPAKKKRIEKTIEKTKERSQMKTGDLGGLGKRPKLPALPPFSWNKTAPESSQPTSHTSSVPAPNQDVLQSILSVLSTVAARIESMEKEIRANNGMLVSLMDSMNPSPSEGSKWNFPLKTLDELRTLEAEIEERPQFFIRIFRTRKPSIHHFANTGLASILTDDLIKKINLKGNYNVEVSLENSSIFEILERAWEFPSHAEFLNSIRDQIRRAHARHTSSLRRRELKEKKSETPGQSNTDEEETDL